MRKIFKISLIGVIFSFMIVISSSSLYAENDSSKSSDKLGTWLNEKTNKTASTISDYGLEEPVSSIIESNRNIIITKIAGNPEFFNPKNLTSNVSSNFGITYDDLKPRTFEKP